MLMIPPKWSRIISFEEIDDYEVVEYNVEDDIKDMNDDPLRVIRA